VIGWNCIFCPGYGLGGDEFHVVPVDDLRKHEEQASCWCNPTEDPEQAWIHVHHALDGREEYENGRAAS
jgi:hypothetical protein